eukprot:4490108-Prymnesium_polylepis.1
MRAETSNESWPAEPSKGKTVSTKRTMQTKSECAADLEKPPLHGSLCSTCHVFNYTDVAVHPH